MNPIIDLDQRRRPVADPADIEHRDAYLAIVGRLDALDAAKESVEEAEQQLTSELRASLSKAPSLISQLYWDNRVKITLLAGALSLTPGEMRRLIDPNRQEVECVCGDRFAVLLRSHADQKLCDDGKLRCLACAPGDNYRYGRGWPERMPGLRDLTRVSELRAMPYHDYLRTPEWAATRQRELERAHFSCQVCSSKYGLQVHHRTYDRFGSEQPRDLLVLCSECHALFHKNGRLQR